MADRWAKAEILRDVFELLAREIPLVDRPNRPATRLSEKTITAIQTKLPQVRALIVHRSILRMIEEMISEDFPRLKDNGQIPHPPSVAGMLASSITPLMNRTDTPMNPTSMTFQLPFSAQQQFNFGGSDVDLQDINTEGLLEFPGMFDFDSWG